ncbi:MAG: stage II sporulation protein M [Verrucomicrobiota bacterium]
MNRQQFEKENQDRWDELTRILHQLDEGHNPVDSDKLPGLFRQVCSDLSLAQYRMYGVRLCDRLNQLVIAGYKHVYRGANATFSTFLKYFSTDFPRVVRREWRLVTLAMLMFWGPFAALIVSAYVNPQWLQAVLSPQSMEMVEGMYGKGERSQVEYVRDRFGSNFAMFGFYIYNNVRIAFVTFAGGILCGLGTMFFLIFNGTFIGAIVGYVHFAGDTEKLYSFVAGHSAFELTGIILAGVAGLRLGLSIIKTTRLPRKKALAKGAREAVHILYGAATLIVLAAFIEGFWSAQPLDPSLKYGVGIFLWVVLILYFVFAGHTRPRPNET